MAEDQELVEIMGNVEHPARVLLRAYLAEHPETNLKKYRDFGALAPAYIHMKGNDHSLYETSPAILAEKELLERNEPKQ